MQEKHFAQELSILSQGSFYEPQKLDRFINRLQSHKKKVRSEDPEDHYCAFFLPVHFSSKKIYLGHHKKATFWIPPGAHIEAGESPRQTVKREIMEELQYTVSDEQIELFDLSVTVCNPGVVCRLHYDFWYLIHMPKLYHFRFEEREFYDAKWVSLSDVMTLDIFPAYKQIFQHLAQKIHADGIMR